MTTSARTRTTKSSTTADLAVMLREIERRHVEGNATRAQTRHVRALICHAGEYAASAPTTRLKAALDAAVACRTLGHSTTWAVAGDALVDFAQYDALATRVKADRLLQARLRAAERAGGRTLYRLLRRLIDTTPTPEALLVPLHMDDLRDGTYADAA